MADKLRKTLSHLHAPSRGGLLVTAVAGLVVTVLFLTGPATWATPGQSPEKQTIPTPTTCS